MCEAGASIEPYGPHFMEDQHIVGLGHDDEDGPVASGWLKQRLLCLHYYIVSPTRPIVASPCPTFCKPLQ
jgi:hypothetical protein